MPSKPPAAAFAFVILAFLLSLSFSPFAAATAFSPMANPRSGIAYTSLLRNPFAWRSLRGGGGGRGSDVGEAEAEASTGESSSSDATDSLTAESSFQDEPRTGGAALVSLSAAGRFYSRLLESRPVVTKSATAGLIFVLSDVLAQAIERSSSGGGESSKGSYNWVRTISSGLVGLLYFGPAAHYWYMAIFRVLPGTSLASTLAKAFWGQVLFGPSFTCVFFAASLLQAGTFTPGNWWSKIKSDLPAAWLAGVGYWPLVDLVSYSLVPMKWIPLFVNVMSLIWTVYLSIVSNRNSN